MTTMADFIPLYNCGWPTSMDPVEIELECIRRGGRWQDEFGDWCGADLFTHYKNAMSLLWPADDHHRWSDLILKTYLEERITVVTGARDAGKTRTISKIGLIDYWLSPETTLIIMTSTTVQGLELRVWGDIKNLFQQAREKYPWLAGNVVDAKHGLFTDDIGEDGDVRVMNRGIIGIPLISSQNEYQGQALKNFAGIKQKRRRLFGDELQFIHVDYLKVLDSMDKGDFKAGFLGNPIANNGKALDRVSEPKEGWEAQKEPTKTSVWRNKYNGITINLVGIDSPNFDPKTHNQFPYLVSQADVDSVASRPGGKESVEWWSLILGIRKAGVILDRVLTVEMVRSCNGFDPVIWMGDSRTRIYAIDAGFGGDPCVATYLEFGRNTEGIDVLDFGEQNVIPVRVDTNVTPERQIADYTKADCILLGVPDRNIFVECGMRATLGIAMAQIIGPGVNAINFGGPATQRPVSNDLFVFDQKTKQRRPKTCYEHYSKFVTELAFSVRYAVESGQVRNFPMLAAKEFELRETRFVYGDRHELETKDQYKKRTAGQSPNFSDSVMVAVEGARRNGFQIRKLADAAANETDLNWLEDLLAKRNRLLKSKELVRA